MFWSSPTPPHPYGWRPRGRRRVLSGKPWSRCVADHSAVKGRWSLLTRPGRSNTSRGCGWAPPCVVGAARRGSASLS
eukprot:11036367-Alexandrium_andersonii.AAC.1